MVIAGLLTLGLSTALAAFNPLPIPLTRGPNLSRTSDNCYLHQPYPDTHVLNPASHSEIARVPGQPFASGGPKTTGPLVNVIFDEGTSVFAAMFAFLPIDASDVGPEFPERFGQVRARGGTKAVPETGDGEWVDVEGLDTVLFTPNGNAFYFCLWEADVTEENPSWRKVTHKEIRTLLPDRWDE